ncbi:MAG: alginate lyase family protein [Flavisolibacter sp.]
MKKTFLLLLLNLPLLLLAQGHQLQKLWETDTVVAIPESVLPVSKDLLYVSLIDGGGWDADGKGGVAQLGTNGKNYRPNWVTGLNAPKGLGKFGNHLYAADISEVVVIDIAKGKVEKKIAIEGASGLNDITVSDKGIVYVSDSKTAKVWRIEKDKPSLYLENINGVNGLKCMGEDLIIGGGKKLIRADRNKQLTTIVELPQSIDGIEPVGNGDFIATAWAGYIYYVYANGKFETLLDSHDQKMNTADIGYDQAKKIVYVPTFNAKKIVAYHLVSANGSAMAPRVLIMDGKKLADLKTKWKAKDTEVSQMVSQLKTQADGLLDMKPVSVMDKSFTPVSGDKHDYMSQAPYFWYDSSKPNGLPYIRRDGQHNPEIKKITDHQHLDELSSAVRTLSLAWYFTGDEKYAEKASYLLHYWFYNPTTLMNPNLNYGQGIPGITNGRGIGIIETRSLMGIADAVGLLNGAASWTFRDQQSMEHWYRDYLDWLLTSKNGRDEHAAKNNHGSWYYAQAIDFALFTGDQNKAKELVQESKKLLDSQLTVEGKFPLELERTNGLGYSTFNTQAWFSVAKLAETTGTDLWHFTTSKGVGLRNAVDWLAPYALGEKKWTYQQIGPYNKNEFYPLLLQASQHYPEGDYLKQAKTIQQNGNDALLNVLYRG